MKTHLLSVLALAVVLAMAVVTLPASISVVRYPQASYKQKKQRRSPRLPPLVLRS